MERGDAFDGIGEMARVGEVFLSSRRADEGGGDGVHGDAILAPLDSEALGQMRDERAFLGTSLLAAGAACVPLPVLPSCKIEYSEDVSPNYRAWREALIEKVAKQGYRFRSGWLKGL